MSSRTNEQPALLSQIWTDGITLAERIRDLCDSLSASEIEETHDAATGSRLVPALTELTQLQETFEPLRKAWNASKQELTEDLSSLESSWRLSMHAAVDSIRQAEQRLLASKKRCLGELLKLKRTQEMLGAYFRE